MTDASAQILQSIQFATQAIQQNRQFQQSLKLKSRMMDEQQKYHEQYFRMRQQEQTSRLKADIARMEYKKSLEDIYKKTAENTESQEEIVTRVGRIAERDAMNQLYASHPEFDLYQVGSLKEMSDRLASANARLVNLRKTGESGEMSALRDLEILDTIQDPKEAIKALKAIRSSLSPQEAQDILGIQTMTNFLNLAGGMKRRIERDILENQDILGTVKTSVDAAFPDIQEETQYIPQQTEKIEDTIDNESVKLILNEDEQTIQNLLQKVQASGDSTGSLRKVRDKMVQLGLDDDQIANIMRNLMLRVQAR